MGRLGRWFGNGAEGILDLLITLLCVLISLTIHEFAHGYMAYLRGDKTAKYTGRLSLNPIHHIDPIGALCLFLFGFGWAKPVMVNPRNFQRRTIKLDMVLTSIAGPLANFILAFISIFVMMAVATFTDGFIVEGGEIMYYSDVADKYSLLVIRILSTLTMMNLGLGLFNLIPIPPLDGSKILSAVLPTRIYFKMMEYERFGFIALIILINLPIFNLILNTLMNGVWSGFVGLSNLILGIFA